VETTRAYPVTAWVAGAIVTVALAVGIRVGAALADVDVVIDRRGAEGPADLELGGLLVVTLAVFVLVVAAVLVLDHLWPERSRSVVRAAVLVLLLASLVSVVLGDTPTDALVVTGLLHLVVAIGVIRTVVRE
jgi:hypothetical protein